MEVVEEMRMATADQATTRRWAARIVADYEARMRKYNLIRLVLLLRAWTKRYAKPVHQG